MTGRASTRSARAKTTLPSYLRTFEKVLSTEPKASGSVSSKQVEDIVKAVGLSIRGDPNDLKRVLNLMHGMVDYIARRRRLIPAALREIDEITALISKLQPLLRDMLDYSSRWTLEAEDHKALYDFLAEIVEPAPYVCTEPRAGKILAIHKQLNELEMWLRGLLLSFGVALPLHDHSRTMTNRVLIGTVLPLVYEDFFQKKFGIARDAKENALKGPGVRFLIGTVQALGVKGEDGRTLSTESLVSYWKKQNLEESEWVLPLLTRRALDRLNRRRVKSR